MTAFLISGCRNDPEYPPEIIVEDPEIPEVALPETITFPAADLTRFSVKFIGLVTDTGLSEISEVGFVVDTEPDPTIDRNLNKFIKELGPNDTLRSIVINIPAGKTYYFKAYATTKKALAMEMSSISTL